MNEQTDLRAPDYLYEAGLLKRYKRTGWVIAGVPTPESIADHSHRAALHTFPIGQAVGADQF